MVRLADTLCRQDPYIGALSTLPKVSIIKGENFGQPDPALRGLDLSGPLNELLA